MELIVKLYQDESGWWIAECLGLRGCITQAETREGAIEMIKDAAAGWLEVWREDHPGMEWPIQAQYEPVKVTV
jgi:predicted RNase H-like HicB family nuclease